MSKKTILIIFLILMSVISGLSREFTLTDKKIDYKEDKILFSMEFEIAQGYDIKDLNKSLKISIDNRGLKLENVKTEKSSFGIIKTINISGEIKVLGKKGLKSDTAHFSVSYRLCGETSSVCLISKTDKIDIPLDKTKLMNYKSKFSPWYMLLLFLSGIVTSFTPCVFPLIPLVFGFMGAAGKNPKKALALSSVMVVSMGVVYSALGVFAALSGKVFGSFTKSPIFMIIIGVIMIVMGISLMGVIPFKTPSFVSKNMRNYKGKGFLSAIAMGLLLGAIGAPCVGPVLVSVLSYVSTTQNAILGGLMLFSYSMGIGVVFVVAGTLSQSLGKGLSQGKWMEFLKYVFSLLIIGGGVYFMDMGLKTNILIYIYLLFFGLWLIKESMKIEKKLAKGILMVLAIGILIFPGYKLYYTIHNHKAESNINWVKDYDKAIKKAKEEKKPVFIDFYADWCENCHKLEGELSVIYPSLKDKVVFLQINMDEQNPIKDKLVKKYNIVGLPGVIIQCPDGDKLNGFFGFKEKDKLLKIINGSIEKGKENCGG
jgi:thiol:disulfide interchange protein DsbD